MRARWVSLCALVCVTSFAVGASAAELFDKVYCLQYATLENYPLDRLLWNAPRAETVDAPFAMCAAVRGADVVLLDSGYVNQEVGTRWGAGDYNDYKALFGEVGLSLDQVTHVTLSHLHWDHAGGTSRFPNAKFIIQKRELEYASGGLPGNSMARIGFEEADVVDLVKLNWAGRVILVDGDREGILPGVDVYLTPGHTIGTLTACVATKKGRICYASDAVYTYQNIDDDIPLGLAYNATLSVDSFEKIRQILRGGILIPGHDRAMFTKPGDFGFRRVSENVIAVVE
jgi:glyoxylase-like metal-dependent hydrolase (beta-lactamase superfamily II)